MGVATMHKAAIWGGRTPTGALMTLRAASLVAPIQMAVLMIVRGAMLVEKMSRAAVTMPVADTLVEKIEMVGGMTVRGGIPAKRSRISHIQTCHACKWPFCAR